MLASGLLVTVLDGSIVTVAMPAIQKDLGFSEAGLLVALVTTSILLRDTARPHQPAARTRPLPQPHRS